MKKAHLGAIAFFTLAAIAMTWPLAANLPLAAAHPGDPSITAWMLDWAFYALTHHPARLFHANIFHPLPYTFAFSENLIGIVVVLAPLLALKLPLMLVHNIAILIGFASAGYAAALLGRYLTGSMFAGVVGGFFFAFVPWRFTHLTHLQHLWTLWLPLLILAILRLGDRPTWPRAAWFFICFVMNGLTNLHWLAFGSVAALLCVIVLADSRRFVALSAVAMFAGTLALAPMLYPYWRARELYGMRGDAGETRSYSARPSDWLIASLHNRVYGPRLNDGSVDPERWSFPGLIALLLAIAGITRLPRRHAILAIALIALGFLGSLGLHTPFGRFLFEHVPLFGGIRVPARWSMIAYLGIAMLACAGAATIARRQWQCAMLLAVLALELRAAPIRWYLGTGETAPVYTWLAQQRVIGGVLELPPGQAHVYGYQFNSHVHHQRLINGVSGFKPPPYAAIERDWQPSPIPDSILRGSVVILHRDLLGDRAADAEALMARSSYVRAGESRGSVVYATLPQKESLTAIPASRPAIDGALLHPEHWEEITGPLEVTGQSTATHVLLHFDNHRVTFETRSRNGRFAHAFPLRPANVRADTDLQVELIDARGHHRLLPQVWLRWRRPGECLTDRPLPQTADLGPYVQHALH